MLSQRKRLSDAQKSMAMMAATRTKAEACRAEAGLQLLQLSVVHEVKVPLASSQAFLKVSQPRTPEPDLQVAAPATPSLTHLVQVSEVATSVDGQTFAPVDTAHLMAWADATMAAARMTI